ncbi:MAG: adenylate/guanylate cyclase domain-containing protein [Candidatus Marinimicrobia bacterium]|nr:adenylate/guanylate cyclase domain-containing protein [Candidatus Neomarinimicrobiota bacterium]MBT5225738.1 adenylate/guanylate cyclase domain-containing protein [Candidatus Neomarinimicrobiota bacterium]MBT5748364.1 adenylate/guanylate cyclase domain-containing protein [Candidatus Neomarinimicrobiota bacterium]MBT6413951.1 adenylate/guanylate cyclase domain-containing protein [Candidatus Neomarinimicrobiota bacterium]MBT6797363.1 adenylate/guanylate cyclase domain-containing protein [Candi
MTDRQKRILMGLVMGIVASLFVHHSTRISGFFLTDPIDGYEYKSYDARMKSGAAFSEEASIDDVVIIDIEQNSVESMGNYHEWPHAYHGQLTDVVSSGNPKALIFDIIFDEKGADNYYLVDALASNQTKPSPELQQVTNQYLANNDPTQFVRSTSKSTVAHHALVFENSDSINFLYAMDQLPEAYDAKNHVLDISPEIAEKLPTAERLGNTYFDLLTSAHGAGAANFPQDEDGMIRRAPTAIHFKGSGKVFPTLVLSAVMDILGIPANGFLYDFDNHLLRLRDTTGTTVREIPIDEQGRMYVNYYGMYKTFYYIPYMYCFDPDMLDPSYWDGKVALVGSSLPGLMDLRNTPVQETFAGVEIHANVIHSILQNEFVKRASNRKNFLSILFLAVLIGTLSAVPKKPFWGFLILGLGVMGWQLFSYSQFLEQRFMWEVIRPTLSMTLAQLGIFSYTFLVLEKDKRFLKNTFSTYISPELIDQMYDNKEEPKLGGTEGYHTALFTDIQSFSGFSEKLTPSELVELLNDYLTEMTDILLENKGTLDKYIGDAIVAFYGAPAPVSDHEYWACLTAVRMQDRLAELREKWQGDGERWPEIVHHMQNRIGINTGPMVTGNMGSAMRMNYTMMGDTVNLAARLEASAKQYGVYIQVAEESYKACKDKFIWRDLDFVIVMGKTEPAQVFELIAEIGNMPPGYDKLLPAYDEALKLYRNQEWAKAIDAFKASDELESMFPGRKTNPSRIYIPRCEHYKENRPGDDWDGAWILLSK